MCLSLAQGVAQKYALELATDRFFFKIDLFTFQKLLNVFLEIIKCLPELDRFGELPLGGSRHQ